jgi:hypothetical protein
MSKHSLHLLYLVLAAAAAMSLVAGCADVGTPDDDPGDDPYDGGYATLTGYVLDAVTGDPVPDASVNAGGDAGVSDEAGHFVLDNIEVGTVTVLISKDGYVSLSTLVTFIEDAVVEQDFAILPQSTTDEYRIVLSWGQNPGDLDSHLWVPLDGVNYWHVYFSTDGYLDAVPYAALDTDDTSSYGPETITIRTHEGDYYEGEYVYVIHHYSGSGNLETSGAQVRVYAGDSLAVTVNAPQGCEEGDRYWYVGRLNCREGIWIPINTYGPSSPMTYARTEK